MWKVSSVSNTESETLFLLMDIEDDNHFIEVNLPTYQVLEDMGLIQGECENE